MFIYNNIYMVLVADSEEDLQEMLGALRGYCAKWRLFVNVAKTKGMVCGGSRLEKTDFQVRRA